MSKLMLFFKKHRVLKSYIGNIVGTILYCFAIVFILDFGKFYAGGVTGVSQLVANIVGVPYVKSILICVINIPLLVIGWRGVSKRFAVSSLVSTLIQIVVIALFDYIKVQGFNPFASLAIMDGDKVTNPLVFAIIGGALTGAGCGISLRAGASTGGTDIISQKLAFRSNASFSLVSGTIDAAIIALGAIEGKSISIAVYTIIRLVMHLTILDKIHTIYKIQKISIITKKREELQKALLEKFKHGMTIFQAIGGYTNESKWNIEAIILTYEREEYERLVLSIDPCAFITYYDLNGIKGNYNKKAIN